MNSQHSRLLELERLLERNVFPKREVLERDLGVGYRQLRRDMVTFEEITECKVAYDKTRGGYGYAVPPSRPVAAGLGLEHPLGNLVMLSYALGRRCSLRVTLCRSHRSMEILPFFLCPCGGQVVVVAAHPQTFQFLVFRPDQIIADDSQPFHGDWKRIQSQITAEWLGHVGRDDLASAISTL